MNNSTKSKELCLQLLELLQMKPEELDKLLSEDNKGKE